MRGVPQEAADLAAPFEQPGDDVADEPVADEAVVDDVDE
jgi:hypothetical protein